MLWRDTQENLDTVTYLDLRRKLASKRAAPFLSAHGAGGDVPKIVLDLPDRGLVSSSGEQSERNLQHV